MQLSLLASAPTQADETFERAQRIPLGTGAWLDWVPGWLTGHERLFERLRLAAKWERHGRQMYERYLEIPRLVASCPGVEGGLKLPGEEVLETRPSGVDGSEQHALRSDLEAIGALLSARYGRALDRITLAYYRDGQDSVAFHGDKLGVLKHDSVVAILSLGAPRRFLLRPAGGGAGSPPKDDKADGDEANGDKAGHGGAGDGNPDDGKPAGNKTGWTARRFHCGEGDLLVMGGDCQETWEHGVPKSAQAGPRIALMFRETVGAEEASDQSSESGASDGRGDASRSAPADESHGDTGAGRATKLGRTSTAMTG